MQHLHALLVQLFGWPGERAFAIITGAEWIKVCDEMYAALPPQQAKQALSIIIRHRSIQ